MKDPSLGVAIITHCARDHLCSCLPPLLASPLKPRVLVVNSSSQDGTVEEAERLGAETWVIPRTTFNHGKTREAARKRLGTDIVVMMTPDAYPESTDLLERLTAPLRNQKASAAYARQLPHQGAGRLEAFARHFNYPEKSHIRGIEDAKNYGAYLCFCSDSCAAYWNAALEAVGGFRPTLTAEDSLVIARLLRAGGHIAYVAEAKVRHSHRYTLMQEFKRHFDTGYVRHQNRHLLNFEGTDSQLGRRYIRELLCSLWRDCPRLIPYAVLQCLIKYVGYRVGFGGQFFPKNLKRVLSAQDYYWN